MASSIPAYLFKKTFPLRRVAPEFSQRVDLPVHGATWQVTKDTNPYRAISTDSSPVISNWSNPKVSDDFSLNEHLGSTTRDVGEIGSIGEVTDYFGDPILSVTGNPNYLRNLNLTSPPPAINDVLPHNQFYDISNGVDAQGKEIKRWTPRSKFDAVAAGLRTQTTRSNVRDESNVRRLGDTSIRPATGTVYKLDSKQGDRYQNVQFGQSVSLAEAYPHLVTADPLNPTPEALADARRFAAAEGAVNRYTGEPYAQYAFDTIFGTKNGEINTTQYKPGEYRPRGLGVGATVIPFTPIGKPMTALNVPEIITSKVDEYENFYKQKPGLNLDDKTVGFDNQVAFTDDYFKSIGVNAAHNESKTDTASRRYQQADTSKYPSYLLEQIKNAKLQVLSPDSAELKLVFDETEAGHHLDQYTTVREFWDWINGSGSKYLTEKTGITTPLSSDQRIPFDLLPRAGNLDHIITVPAPPIEIPDSNGSGTRKVFPQSVLSKPNILNRLSAWINPIPPETVKFGDFKEDSIEALTQQEWTNKLIKAGFRLDEIEAIKAKALKARRQQQFYNDLRLRGQGKNTLSPQDQAALRLGENSPRSIGADALPTNAQMQNINAVIADVDFKAAAEVMGKQPLSSQPLNRAYVRPLDTGLDENFTGFTAGNNSSDFQSVARNAEKTVNELTPEDALLEDALNNGQQIAGERLELSPLEKAYSDEARYIQAPKLYYELAANKVGVTGDIPLRADAVARGEWVADHSLQGAGSFINPWGEQGFPIDTPSATQLMLDLSRSFKAIDADPSIAVVDKQARKKQLEERVFGITNQVGAGVTSFAPASNLLKSVSEDPMISHVRQIQQEIDASNLSAQEKAIRKQEIVRQIKVQQSGRLTPQITHELNRLAGNVNDVIPTAPMVYSSGAALERQRVLKRLEAQKRDSRLQQELQTSSLNPFLKLEATQPVPSILHGQTSIPSALHVYRPETGQYVPFAQALPKTESGAVNGNMLGEFMEGDDDLTYLDDILDQTYVKLGGKYHSINPEPTVLIDGKELTTSANPFKSYGVKQDAPTDIHGNPLVASLQNVPVANNGNLTNRGEYARDIEQELRLQGQKLTNYEAQFANYNPAEFDSLNFVGPPRSGAGINDRLAARRDGLAADWDEYLRLHNDLISANEAYAYARKLTELEESPANFFHATTEADVSLDSNVIGSDAYGYASGLWKGDRPQGMSRFVREFNDHVTQDLEFQGSLGINLNDKQRALAKFKSSVADNRASRLYTSDPAANMMGLTEDPLARKLKLDRWAEKEQTGQSTPLRDKDYHLTNIHFREAYIPELGNQPAISLDNPLAEPQLSHKIVPATTASTNNAVISQAWKQARPLSATAIPEVVESLGFDSYNPQYIALDAANPMLERQLVSLDLPFDHPQLGSRISSQQVHQNNPVISPAWRQTRPRSATAIPEVIESLGFDSYQPQYISAGAANPMTEQAMLPPARYPQRAVPIAQQASYAHQSLDNSANLHHLSQLDYQAVPSPEVLQDQNLWRLKETYNLSDFLRDQQTTRQEPITPIRTAPPIQIGGNPQDRVGSEMLEDTSNIASLPTQAVNPESVRNQAQNTANPKGNQWVIPGLIGGGLAGLATAKALYDAQELERRTREQEQQMRQWYG